VQVHHKTCGKIATFAGHMDERAVGRRVGSMPLAQAG
jgi:hypothetical protein